MLELQLISALALLVGAYGAMEISWAKRLESRSELMHPAFVSDYSFAWIRRNVQHLHVRSRTVSPCLPCYTSPFVTVTPYLRPCPSLSV